MGNKVCCAAAWQGRRQHPRMARPAPLLTWRHRVHTDAIGRELTRRQPRERHHAVLGGGVACNTLVQLSGSLTACDDLRPGMANCYLALLPSSYSS
jgi:hypothetical protein